MYRSISGLTYEACRLLLLELVGREPERIGAKDARRSGVEGGASWAGLPGLDTCEDCRLCEIGARLRLLDAREAGDRA